LPVETSLGVPTKAGVKSIGSLLREARDPKNLGKIRTSLIENGLLGKNVKSTQTIQNQWLNILIGSQTSQMDPFEYMKQLKASGFGTDTAGGPAVQKYAHNYSGSTGDALFRKAFNDVFGRNPSKDDYSSPFKDSSGKALSWVQVLDKEAKKPENYTTVSRNADGSLTTTNDPFDAGQWLTNQLTSTYSKAIQSGTMSAEQKIVDKYAALAKDYGISVIDPSTKKFTGTALKDLADIETGVKTLDDFQNNWKNAALAQYGSTLKTQLDSGLSLYQAAKPAIDTIASILEVDPNGIDLNNKYVQQYLHGDGKSVMPTYKLQAELRKDPSWAYTNNAQNLMDGLSTDLMKRFGVVG
jgi:hypothetical protein